jgi:DNA-binding NtrC family response regulator
MTEQSKGTILIADDEEVNRNFYHTVIGNTFPDYETETFVEGDSLKGRLERSVERISLVFTDNEMPGTSGGRIIKEYSRRAGFEKIPFILCYGGPAEIGEEAVRDGAFGYLLKPTSISDILGMINKALGRG